MYGCMENRASFCVIFSVPISDANRGISVLVSQCYSPTFTPLNLRLSSWLAE